MLPRFLLAASAGLAALGLAACAPKQAHAASPPAPAAQQVTMDVFPASYGVPGPDGRGHDAFVPDGFVVQAGQPVHLAVTNYTGIPHTITADADAAGFGPFFVEQGKTVGKAVQPVTTTFDFTPAHVGVFRWHCEAKCDLPSHWAMHHALYAPGAASKQWGVDGFMAGVIVVR